MGNLDILRLSVTFLAFATVVFILTTSWTVFNSQVDRGSCQKLLESALEIKDALHKLNVNDRSLFKELETVQGQKSELLRAIIESDFDGSRPGQNVPQVYADNNQHMSNPNTGDSDASDDREEPNQPMNSDESDLGPDDTGKIQICIFGRYDVTSRITKEIECERMNVTVELVKSLDTTDIQSAHVTLFNSTQQKYGWWQALLQKRESHQRWALLSMVPPTSSSEFTSVPKAFKANTFHWTVNYNYICDVPLLFGVYRDSDTIDDPARTYPTYKKSKLVAYRASDCEEEKWPRANFLSVLGSFIDIEEFGCGPCDAECEDRMKEFRFVLALESTPCRGYITEVFWSALADHQSVPIVWGAQPDDYVRVAPEHSYIDITRFDSIKSLADHITKVGNSQEQYEKYHEWRQTGEAEVLIRMEDIPNVPYDSHICSIAQRYLDSSKNSGTFRDTNRNDWRGACSIRPTDVQKDLPLPPE